MAVKEYKVVDAYPIVNEIAKNLQVENYKVWRHVINGLFDEPGNLQWHSIPDEEEISDMTIEYEQFYKILMRDTGLTYGDTVIIDLD